MSEKEISTVELRMGNDSRGCFEYEIHEVIFDGIKQYRLRLKDYRDRLRVRFAKTVYELQQAVELLLKET